MERCLTLLSAIVFLITIALVVALITVLYNKRDEKTDSKYQYPNVINVKSFLY